MNYFFFLSLVTATSTCLQAQLVSVRALSSTPTPLPPRRDQKNEPTISLPSGVHTKQKPKTIPLNLAICFSFKGYLGLGLVFRVSYRFCVSGILRWSNISLVHFSGRTIVI